ncbi:MULTISPECIES: hypothetical protein [Haloferax]|uniref:DUF8107 domain-containing protein n=2 Tax=Haloferax gibbonsii TaxID=35746 RepID=A0A0K1IWX8_HALGI|nr:MULTISPECIES: hypothetical protein [Haloferax]AKU08949.1 hypothetical protein ABY42_14845 [Haloferax gibbonsii]ELZ82009.1 hypothetical protein C454_07698 [Haloferax gibbonsii ATCC 33959]QOS13207.1 uncharacterized protein HfgLR_15400 [Haloferax gibbonsii]RDZ53986.1 hypothetical protein C5C07_00195 [Haloferax sp. Atlit-4N]REA06356.1 hypothetical protein DEQ92_08880 [Haloferax sp. Atlit-6N]
MSGEAEGAGSDDEGRGADEIEWGEGDPRVLFVMNLVLSTAFAAVVVYGLSYLDLAAFSVVNVASAALVLTAVTYLVTN